MKFQLSKDDIEKGKRYSVDLCPVALCIRRKKKKFYVMVTQSSVVCKSKKISIVSNLPSNMTSFIKKFDKGEFNRGEELPCFNLNFRKVAGGEVN